MRRSSTALIVRAVMLGISGAASLVLSRLVVSENGTLFFAAWATIASLPLLVPIGDLGLGAILTNLAAQLPLGGEEFLAARRRVLRILWTISISAALPVTVAGFLRIYSRVLDTDVPGVDFAAAASLLLYILSIPASIATRVLVGVRRNAMALFVQGLITPLTLVLAFGGIAMGVPSGLLLICPTLAYATATWALWAVAAVSLRPMLAHLVPARRSPPLRGTAVSAAVIGLLLPMAFQSHRLVLANAQGAQSVAAYSAVALVGLPLLSVVQSVGVSLWGEFRSLPPGDVIGQRKLLLRAYRFFAVIATVAAAGLVTMGPVVVAWATADRVAVPWSTYVAFAVLILVQALQLPSGMLLTDEAGLRLQALLTIGYVPMCIVASYLFALWLGAPGPLFATAVCLFGFLLVPCAVRGTRLTRPASGLVHDVIVAREVQAEEA